MKNLAFLLLYYNIVILSLDFRNNMALLVHSAVPNCVGNAGSCDKRGSPDACVSFTGCKWNNVQGRCQGFPTQCEDILDCQFCKNHGVCSWYDNNSNTPKECPSTAPPTTLNDFSVTGSTQVTQTQGSTGGSYSRKTDAPQGTNGANGGFSVPESAIIDFESTGDTIFYHSIGTVVVVTVFNLITYFVTII